MLSKHAASIGLPIRGRLAPPGDTERAHQIPRRDIPGANRWPTKAERELHAAGETQGAPFGLHLEPVTLLGTHIGTKMYGAWGGEGAKF